MNDHNGAIGISPRRASYALRRLGVRFDSEGQLRSMPDAEAVECLRRLYLRNSDPASPDFENLTSVQSKALYTVLSKLGVRVPDQKRSCVSWGVGLEAVDSVMSEQEVPSEQVPARDNQ